MEMFIADTHFGHANILGQCRPQFATIEEMNRTIIDNINCKMTRKDLLYIVGDFSFRSQTPPTEFLEAIKPRKILIIGNHDDSWLKKLSEEEIARYFVGVYPAYSYKKNGIGRKNDVGKSVCHAVRKDYDGGRKPDCDANRHNYWHNKNDFRRSGADKQLQEQNQKVD